MKFLIALLIIPAAVFAVWCLLLCCRRNHDAWPVLRRFRYAHRGYHDKPAIPENSMAAFRRAVERDWGAELDVHLMADGNLAVIHDSNLRRTAGADVQIENLTLADLDRYCLEESQEHIPLLQDVLALFAGKTPLIIELKTAGSNFAALCPAVAAVLDRYEGDYCIESFDPRAVWWFRKHRPRVCRGQLAENFLADKGAALPGYQKFVLTNLLTNLLTRPDFIAYRFEDRHGLSLRLCRAVWRPVEVSWTLRSKEQLDAAEQAGNLCIFERFDPEK